MVVGSTGEAYAATAPHLRPVGNPAPPRPRSPDAATSITPAGPSRTAASNPLPPPACSYSARVRTGRAGRTRGVKATAVILAAADRDANIGAGARALRGSADLFELDHERAACG